MNLIVNAIINYLINFGVLILIFLAIYGVKIYIKEVLLKKHKITPEQIKLLENASQYAVLYAEQMYKADNLVDRFKLAFDYVDHIVKQLDLNFPEIEKIVKGLIESQVQQLPQTHKLQ
jgi:hypothetical protein